MHMPFQVRRPLLSLTAALAVAALAACPTSTSTPGEPDTAEPDAIADAGVDDDAGVPEVATVDLATWNLMFFPASVDATALAADVVDTEGWDMLAVQEMYSAGAVDDLLALLPGWEGLVYPEPAGAALSVGLLYDANVFELVEGGPLTALDATFSRTPMEAVLRERTTGVELHVVSVHLTSGIEAPFEQARLEEIAALEPYVRPFVDDGEHLVVLGDYNEAPTDPRYDEVLAPFFDDTARYDVLSRHLRTPEDATFLPASVILDQLTVSTSLSPLVDDGVLPHSKVNVVHVEDRIDNVSQVLSDHLPLHIRVQLSQ